MLQCVHITVGSAAGDVVPAARLLFSRCHRPRRVRVASRCGVRAVRATGLAHSLSQRRRQNAAARLRARLVLLAHCYCWSALPCRAIETDTWLAGALCLIYGTIIRVRELRDTEYKFVTFLQSDYTHRQLRRRPSMSSVSGTTNMQHTPLARSASQTAQGSLGSRLSAA